MGSIRRHRPKSLTLIWLWQEHRAALQYDWIHAWHTLYDPETQPLYMAWPMLSEILKDHTSHSHAALADWQWIPGEAEQMVDAINQGQGKTSPPPWQAIRPTPDHMSRPRNEQLHRQLLDRLGIHED